MAKKWKQGGVALLLSLTLYLALPMVSALLAVNEWADAEKLLMPMLLAAALSAVAGTLFLVRRGKWSVFAAALLTAVGTQLLAMLAGYLTFGSVATDGQRWLLPVVGFIAAIAAGIFFGQRKGGRKERRSGKGKRR